MSLLKHLAVFALGFAAFWIGERMLRSQPDPEPTMQSAVEEEASASHASRRLLSSDKRKVTSGDYLEAWEELLRLDPRTAGYRQ